MIVELLKKHLPEWIEAISILLGAGVIVIAVATISLYKIDKVGDAVIRIEEKIENLPLLEHEVLDIKSELLILKTQVHDNEVKCIKVESALGECNAKER